MIQALKLQFKGQLCKVMKSPDVADMLGGKYKSMVSDACRLQCVYWVCSACVGICVLDFVVYMCVCNVLMSISIGGRRRESKPKCGEAYQTMTGLHFWR